MKYMSFSYSSHRCEINSHSTAVWLTIVNNVLEPLHCVITTFWQSWYILPTVMPHVSVFASQQHILYTSDNDYFGTALPIHIGIAITRIGTLFTIFRTPLEMTFSARRALSEIFIVLCWNLFSSCCEYIFSGCFTDNIITFKITAYWGDLSCQI